MSDISNMFVEVVNMSDIFMTKNQIAKSLGVAGTTIQSYLEPAEKLGYKFKKGLKGYEFSNHDFELFKTILQLRKDGEEKNKAIKKAVSNIVDISNMTDVENTPTSTDISDMPVIRNMLENMSNMSRNIADMSVKIDNLEYQNKELKQAYIDQQKYLEDRLEQRDRKLMESLRESLEAKKIMIEVQESLKQIAATQGQKKKGFWVRLFGKA